MKTKTFINLFIMSVITFGAAMALCSCDSKDDGESSADWELRNTINGPQWYVITVKNTGGTWTGEGELPFWFEVKFSASKHNFSSKLFYYKDGEADESTREEYTSANNTAYTIKNAQIIEGTVGGKPYFRMTLKAKVTSELHCDLYFYNSNKTYEVKMSR